GALRIRASMSPYFVPLCGNANPLESTLVDLLVSVENKGLTEKLSFLESTLTKNIGEGGVMANQTSAEGWLTCLSSARFQQRIVEKLPPATSAATASISGASGRSCVTSPDLARTTAYAFLA